MHRHHHIVDHHIDIVTQRDLQGHRTTVNCYRTLRLSFLAVFHNHQHDHNKMHPNLPCGRLIQPKTPEIGTWGISAWLSGRRLTTPVLSKMLVATLNCRRKLLVIAASLILLIVVGLYWSGGREEGTLFCLCSCSACSGTSFTFAKTDELWRRQIYPVAEQLFDIKFASKPLRLYSQQANQKLRNP